MTTTIPMIDSKRLFYTAKTRTFTAEASDFRDVFTRVPGMMDVRSERTKATRRFTMIGATRDREGDITHWEYRDRDRTMQLIIFND